MPNKNLITLKRQQELIMINRVLALLVVVFTFLSGYMLAEKREWLVSQSTSPSIQTPSMDLPSVGLPIGGGADTPLYQLFRNARYSRVFNSSEISKEVLFDLLFAGQGRITSWGERTVPSYKSKFPIILEVLIRNVSGVANGLYWFNPVTQTIEPGGKTLIAKFPETIPGLNNAPVIIIATTLQENMKDMNAWIEAGGVAQNILLAAEEADLTTLYVPTENVFSPNTMWLMPIASVEE